MIYILAPIFNRIKITERFIGELKKQNFTQYHLVILDDGSSDGSAEMVKSMIPEATIITGKGDWWWAGSLQKGIDWLREKDVSKDDLVMFANDDITFDLNFLSTAREILKDSPRTLLLPRIFNDSKGSAFESGVNFNSHKLTFEIAKKFEDINCLSTRGLFLRMGDINLIGNFHTKILPHYLSDYEYTIRAARLGMKLVTNKNFSVEIDYDETGYRDFSGTHFFDFMHKFFSKKNPSNPIFFSVFVLMACKWNHMPRNLIRVWRNAALIVAKNIKDNFLLKLSNPLNLFSKDK